MVQEFAHGAGISLRCAGWLRSLLRGGPGTEKIRRRIPLHGRVADGLQDLIERVARDRLEKIPGGGALGGGDQGLAKALGAAKRRAKRCAQLFVTCTGVIEYVILEPLIF